MLIEDPAEAAIAADLAAARFQAGVVRSYWRRVLFEFPILVIAVAATEPDGSAAEYAFRYELTGYPGIGPEVFIWDPEKDQILASGRRPKGSPRVIEAFKDWGSHTVYRPWERNSGAHNDWAHKYPDLAWQPRRDITFTLEDLHGLLNSNSLARSARAAS
ncbi:MAG: hypothetical protein ABSD38_31825 [Syntrophorhabdales bacterium]|jgi:hypothetical protein